MKVQADQIKRPRLIEPFFDKELTPDNEFVVYIETTVSKNSTPSTIIQKNPKKSTEKDSSMPVTTFYVNGSFKKLDQTSQSILNILLPYAILSDLKTFMDDPKRLEMRLGEFHFIKDMALPKHSLNISWASGRRFSVATAST